MSVNFFSFSASNCSFDDIMESLLSNDLASSSNSSLQKKGFTKDVGLLGDEGPLANVSSVGEALMVQDSQKLILWENLGEAERGGENFGKFRLRFESR
jgi:hypothetical protein